MIVVPAGVKVHLALGHTDMRKGLDGLATLIQEHLKKDPFSGHLFVFRGKKSSLLKILFLGWHGAVPVHQAHRSRKLLVAARGGAWRHGDADTSATRDADRGHRLAHAGALLASTSGRLTIRRNPHQIRRHCFFESACSSSIRHAVRSQ